MNGRIVMGLVVITGINCTAALASEENRAIEECKDTIRDHYDVDRFRNVFADKIGHHRYRVYGKVKRHGHRYPFNCTVKRGWVQSYYYDGPYGDWNNEWTDGGDGYYERERKKRKKHKKESKHHRNVAIGVGLAAVAVAAMAAAANSKQGGRKEDASSSGNAFRYADHVDRTFLEDECGEELGGRVRREHAGVSRIELDEAKVEHQGSMLKGKGIIHWQHRQPTDFNYTCYFDKDGRVMDSSYQYY